MSELIVKIQNNYYDPFVRIREILNSDMDVIVKINKSFRVCDRIKVKSTFYDCILVLYEYIYRKNFLEYSNLQKYYRYDPERNEKIRKFIHSIKSEFFYFYCEEMFRYKLSRNFIGNHIIDYMKYI